MEIKTKKQKLFMLGCETFGDKFSFNAIDKKNAIKKAKKWCMYHSLNFDYNFYIKETNNANLLHNKYIN